MVRRLKSFWSLPKPLIPSDGWGRVDEGPGEGPVEGGNRGPSFRAPDSLLAKLEESEDSVPDLFRT